MTARGALLTIAGALCALAFGLVTLGAVSSLAGAHAGGSSIDIPLLMRTLGVSLLVGVLAAALGLPAAWSMRRLGPGASALLLAPMLLPSYLVYASWGLLRAPGTLIGDALAGPMRAWAPYADFTQAVGGLAVWSWPLAVLVMAHGARSIDARALDALRLSGTSAARKSAVVARAMARPFTQGTLLVAIITLGSAVPLHVAQIETTAISVWRAIDETGGGGAWLMASPILLIALAGALASARLAAQAPHPCAQGRFDRDTGVRTRWVVAAWIGWMHTIMVPIGLFVARTSDGDAYARFWKQAGGAISESAGVALAVAALSLLIATATCIAFSGAHNSGARRVGVVVIAAWVLLALTPGVLVGWSIQRASTSFAALDWAGSTQAGVVIAHTARFGAVAALAGWWLARTEPVDLADQRRLASDGSLKSWARAAGALHAPGLVGVACGTGLLSFHEIESTVMLSPPGRDNLARHLLNQLHYLRVDDLNAACAMLLGFGLVVGSVCALGIGRSARLLGRVAPLFAVVVMVVSCGERPAGDVPMRVRTVFGEAGKSPGQFVYPRAIDSDGEWIYVIDKTGRVQRLGKDGEPEWAWRMPSVVRGFPVGISCGPDGLVYVADTHESRVLVAEAGSDGLTEVSSFGSYGQDDGEFVYVTDIAFATNKGTGEIERFYVSEYGGNDRVSVFDGEHRFLFSFGEEGSGSAAERVEFNRPQSLVFDDDEGVLMVADASNHRVGRFTADGELIAWFGVEGGNPGVGHGEFSYPYGLALLGDGTLLVAEFGNNRVQRIDAETGEGLGLYGRAGRGEGELAYPWGVATMDGGAFVLDSGNNRVIGFDPGRKRRERRAQR